MIRTITRKPQTLKAVAQGIPLKAQVLVFDDKVIISTVAALGKTSTPMITSKIIIDLKELIKTGSFMGVDIRNLNVSIDALK